MGLAQLSELEFQAVGGTQLKYQLEVPVWRRV